MYKVGDKSIFTGLKTDCCPGMEDEIFEKDKMYTISRIESHSDYPLRFDFDDHYDLMLRFDEVRKVNSQMFFQFNSGSIKVRRSGNGSRSKRGRKVKTLTF